MLSLKDFRATISKEENFLNDSVNTIKGGLDNNTEKTTYKTSSDGDFDSEMTCDACSGTGSDASFSGAGG